ncbi:MAG TPA: hypothetical protein DD473_18155 [Planctomycetaceae bacterium]|nr:hypothetical protein [Planctomycetaceae bacterium]
MILSHPGHELRVLGWLKEAKPLVIVLTDGSGHTNEPRIELSRTLIHEAGGRTASIFGSYTDQQFYEAILHQDVKFFQRLKKEITNILIENEIDLVVGDAVEGYNPSHDLCRCLIDRSLVELQKAAGRRPLNYEFPLVALPSIWSDHPEAYCYRLNGNDQEWKLDQIKSYAKTVGGQLLDEVEDSLAKFGNEVLAEEWFTPATSALDLSHFEQKIPFYERHGEQQVSAGHYKNTIRFREHMLPLINAMGADGTA